MNPAPMPPLARSAHRGATPDPLPRTLVGARLRWLAGLLRACVGEATGNAEMEVEGTVTKHLSRIEIENMRSRRFPGTVDPAGPLCAPYDITLHERAARHLELAALHHRQALQWYHAGDLDQGYYHACVAQGFSTDASEIAAALGHELWRSLEGGK